jgi:predicted transposase YbfD/YdcC
MAAEGVFVECVEAVADPRMANKCRHRRMDSIIIGVCATMANGASWDDIAAFGESKAGWLQQWLALPGGIPSAATVRRVFAQVDAAAFQGSFLKWGEPVFERTQGQVIAIDGKTARGTCDNAGQGGLHVVSAWATATLAQVKVADNANEPVAIPQVLELLRVQGCIVTIDATGCQKHIIDTIRTQHADYVVTVKGNQPNLQQALQAAWAGQAAPGWSAQPEAMLRTEATAHGRHESRHCWVLNAAQIQLLGWRDCHTLVRIERSTTRGAKVSHETPDYISSLPAQAALLLHTVHEQWGIENRCHWILDVLFKAEASRTHTRYADDNLALLPKIALTLLHQHPSTGSLKGERYRAALNEDFLVAILKSSFNLMR